LLGKSVCTYLFYPSKPNANVTSISYSYSYPKFYKTSDEYDARLYIFDSNTTKFSKEQKLGKSGSSNLDLLPGQYGAIVILSGGGGQAPEFLVRLSYSDGSSPEWWAYLIVAIGAICICCCIGCCILCCICLCIK